MKKLVTREQLRQFIKEAGLSSAADVQAMLAEPFGETLQEMLEAELEHELGYPKGEATPGANRRNGHSPKKVRSSYGEVELAVPRSAAMCTPSSPWAGPPSRSPAGSGWISGA